MLKILKLIQKWKTINKFNRKIRKNYLISIIKYSKSKLHKLYYQQFNQSHP